MSEKKNTDSISIALMGDIAAIGLISEDQQNNPARYVEPAEILNKMDLAIANLEVPVKAGNEFNEFKDRYHFADLEATRQVLGLLNIGMVSLANNHVYDLKMGGLKATINLLDKLGIKHTGAGWKEEHVEPVIISLKEKKIAFFAYVDIGTNPKTENFNELFLNYFSMEKVLNDVKKVKDKVDLVIVSLHWGVDYSFYPTSTQVEMAQEMTANGVDILMGHHPHTLQPFQKVGDKVIFYSLGGLTFGDYVKKDSFGALFRKTKKSVLVEYELLEKTLVFHSTEELIGNTINITGRDYKKWSSKLWKYYKLKNHNKFFNKIILFHDTVIFRIHEYFFGYYQNPLKRLLQFGNIVKLSKLYRDYSRNTTKKI